MFWKTKQRSITPLEESVLAKMNLARPENEKILAIG
jgi:hypothetical protein